VDPRLEYLVKMDLYVKYERVGYMAKINISFHNLEYFVVDFVRLALTSYPLLGSDKVTTTCWINMEGNYLQMFWRFPSMMVVLFI